MTFVALLTAHVVADVYLYYGKWLLVSPERQQEINGMFIRLLIENQQMAMALQKFMAGAGCT